MARYLVVNSENIGQWAQFPETGQFVYNGITYDGAKAGATITAQNGDTFDIYSGRYSSVQISSAQGQPANPDVTINLLQANSNGITVSTGGTNPVDATVNVAPGITSNTAFDLTNAHSTDVHIGTGASLNNTITGSATGPDTIHLADGSTTGKISAGDGNLTVSAGNNVTVNEGIISTGGHDSITAGTGFKIGFGGSINLGEGNNTITLGDNAHLNGDVITGAGTDSIQLGQGSTVVGTIHSGDGNDTVQIGSGSTLNNTVDLGNGNNLLTGGTDLTLHGSVVSGSGLDTITLGGNASIDGNISTGDGADVVTLGQGSSVHSGVLLGGGDDTLNLGNGGYVFANVDSGTGNDSINIGTGAHLESSLLTGDGSDTVNIGAGSVVKGSVDLGSGDDFVSLGNNTTVNTQVLGGSGNDLIVVGTNVDINHLDSGEGLDTLSGGFLTTHSGWAWMQGGTHSGGMDRLLIDWNAAGITQQQLATTLSGAGWTHVPDPSGGPGHWTGGQPFTLNGIYYSEWEDVGYGPICFAGGTLIETPDGPVAVEDLAVGDLVLTHDHGPQPIRWRGVRRYTAEQIAETPSLRPITLRKGSLGGDMPLRDLTVSPQHRVLVRSGVARRMFGSDEVLVAAKHLTTLAGIDEGDVAGFVDYHHIMFDRHEIVTSNGALTESLYTGSEALKSVGPAAREEIFRIFPALRTGDVMTPAARPIAPARRARTLTERHIRNNWPVVSG